MAESCYFHHFCVRSKIRPATHLGNVDISAALVLALLCITGSMEQKNNLKQGETRPHS
jgi:hypothetical protein